MKSRNINPWLKAIALTIALPLLGFVILGLSWRVTFHWEKDYVQPFYWTLLYIFAFCLIAATPIPLLWAIIRAVRRKTGSGLG